jgi:adenylate cyclase
MRHVIQSWRSPAWRSPARVRPSVVRRVWLWSGLVLFTYVATHLANHALGLISLEAMETGRDWFLLAWRHPVGTVALYGALSAHIVLALSSLYRRRHFRIPTWEALQLLLGLSIPPLLVTHIIGTHLSHAWFNTSDSYTRLVLLYWQFRPDLGTKQTILLTIAWVHGCMGLHFWLRLKPWYPRVVSLLFGIALLVPVLALLGFAEAGREVSRLSQEEGWLDLRMHLMRAPNPAQRAVLERVNNTILGGFAASIGLILAARAMRRLSARRRQMIRITYPDGRETVVPVGVTVLEASRHARIPHASVCGGRGRCSTCRIRVVRGLEFLPSGSPEERRVLTSVGAPPNVRLACQVRPLRDLSVVPLLPAEAQASDGFAQPGYLTGREQEVTVLFADLRGFTAIAEDKLPYDVIFLLNRYFDVVGTAIEQAGGIANQFTGDGVMALFGVQTEPAEGCRQALAAAVAIVHGIADLNLSLVEEMEEPLRVGLGIHTGPAVVGRMGRGLALYLTAVGDTVHVASRLQELTKDYGCQLVISDLVAARADLQMSAFPCHELTVRNRRDPLVIRTIDDVEILTQMPESSQAQ